MAIPAGLQSLLDDGVIDGVRGRLMSGKEAEVFVVQRGEELLAAKVYKAREHRTFKATADYTEGRNQTRNTRDKRAIGKRTTYGKALADESWRDMEYQALHDAFSAGVRVPEPFLLYEDVLLMELLVDEAGAPAPRLSDFDLPADVAELLHREIYGQVRLLLSTGRIHGDLSAFNILIAQRGPTLIDLPQVVDAAGNNQAREILRRDLRNVTEHLATFDARLLRFADCGDALWEHYRRGTLDRATEPQEGSVQRDRGGGRRARDAERGRMGRERAPRNDDRGPRREPAGHGGASANGQAGQRPEARRHDGPPPRQPQQPRRDDRGPPSPPQQPRRDDRRPPASPPQQRPRDERPRRDDRGPPASPPQQRPRDDRPRDERPRRDDRGPPSSPPPRRDDRGPPSSPPPPRRDDRGQPPSAPPRRDDRGPPRRDDRGRPRGHGGEAPAREQLPPQWRKDGPGAKKPGEEP